MRGGESAEIAVPFRTVFIGDIAADGSALLVFSVKDTQVTQERPSLPLWSIPLPTGSPQRLNDASGQAATWSRDRARIVFANGGDIYAANGNGPSRR